MVMTSRKYNTRDVTTGFYKVYGLLKFISQKKTPSDQNEFYPNQLLVLTKMKRLWQTRLFDIEISEAHH